ncbi:hypothetical protein [Rubritalea squalenifaciens]|uniref:hypothetical protein n=1 Tax=Rubritalea squalenifaciens TaxID=407226 RepID=UPI001161450A|nr:hypothetical protein [Rubritalea squalenifaciens]
MLKDCAKGFYQQMFFLGKDVIYPGGNYLQKFGFEKSPSKGLKGTSCYTADWGGGIVELYGACAGYYGDGSKVVFLRERCRFYHWLPPERLVAGMWTTDDVQASSANVMFDAVWPLLNWWLEYEEWIEQQLGADHRKRCYAAWKKLKSAKPWLEPEKVTGWLQHFLDESSRAVRPKHYC